MPDPTSRYPIYRDPGDGPEVAIHAANELREPGHPTATPDGTVIAVHSYAPSADRGRGARGRGLSGVGPRARGGRVRGG